jgi:NitT/TauT family transport system substrate-binding protein
MRGLYLAAAVVAATIAPASAQTIVVSHYGEIMDGLPWAVALDKGYLKSDKLNVTGFLPGRGGGTSIRNVMASPVQYGEVAPSAAIVAILAGVPIRIVNTGVQHISDYVVAINKNSGLHSLKDLEGKKWAITGPKSVTDTLSQMMLVKAGVPLGQVQRPALGSTVADIQALESNSVQATFIIQPEWATYKSRFRELTRASNVLPPEPETVGIASVAYIKAHPDTIRAIIEARRKGVVYAEAHPQEAAAILVKHYEGLNPQAAREAVDELVKDHYWSPGSIDMAGLENTVSGMKLVGLLKGDVDLKGMIDASLLPADLQKTTD